MPCQQAKQRTLARTRLANDCNALSLIKPEVNLMHGTKTTKAQAKRLSAQNGPRHAWLSALKAWQASVSEQTI